MHQHHFLQYPHYHSCPHSTNLVSTLLLLSSANFMGLKTLFCRSSSNMPTFNHTCCASSKFQNWKKWIFD
jgi:hypothetical protein